MYLLVGQWVRAAELCMQIGGILRHVGQGVCDLIVIPAALFVPQVLQGNTRRLPERHLPVGIEAAGGIDGDRQGSDIAALAPAVAEKVAQRRLDGRRGLSIPIDAQHQPPPPAWMDRVPDMLDGTRPLDVGQRDRLPGLNINGGRNFPALSQVAGRVLAVPSVAMPAWPFSPVTFSALMERVLAWERRAMLCRP